MAEVPSLLSMDVKSPLAMAGGGNLGEDFFVRVRGLPFSASAPEIVEFLHDVRIVGGEAGVTFTFTRDGRASGEAYICVQSAQDQAAALDHNREHIGNRYIEVFEANREEMEYVVKKSGPNPGNSTEGVLRMRGLPFGCSKEEIVQFFAGYEIVPNGITMTTDHQGRTSGDAYVQFSSQHVAERAITDKHTKRIGHRYIELFRSTIMEARQAAVGGNAGGPPGRSRPMRPAPYERPERFGGSRGQDSYFPPRERYGGGGSSGGHGAGGGRFRDFGGDRYNSGRGGRGRGGRGGAPRGSRSGGGNNGADHSSVTGHSVHMRGLPFSANEPDIVRFFHPLPVVDVLIGLNEDGRKSGEADVDFETHEDACEAMKKDKSNMEHRYIELFLNSSSYGGGGGGGMRLQGGGSFPMRDNYHPSHQTGRLGGSHYQPGFAERYSNGADVGGFSDDFI